MKHFIFYADQVIAGVTLTQYESEKELNDIVVARSIEDLLPEEVEVTVLEVDVYTEERKHAQVRRAYNRMKPRAGDIEVRYSMFVVNAAKAGYTDEEDAYEKITDEIESATVDGTMTGNIQSNAQDDGSTTLTGASSDEIIFDEPFYPTESPTFTAAPTNDFTTRLFNSVGIVGVSVAGVFIVGCLGFLVCYPYIVYFRRRKNLQNDDLYGLHSGPNGRPLSAAPQGYFTDSNVEMRANPMMKTVQPVQPSFNMFDEEDPTSRTSAVPNFSFGEVANDTGATGMENPLHT